MVDFAKILIHPKYIPELLEHPLLDWVVKVSTSTGLESKDKTAQYGAMKFLYKEGKETNIILKGSLHKLWDVNNRNHKDFYFSNLVDTILKICKDFDLNPYLLKIQNLELGLNVITPFDHKHFVFSNILSYKYIAFQDMETTGKKKIGMYAQQQQFRIKAYSKKKQYNLKEDIFRWELKYRSQERLKTDYDIRNLADLLYPSKLLKGLEGICHKFDRTLIFESEIDWDSLKNRDYQFLRESKHPKYWEQKQTDNKTKKEKDRRHYLSKKFSSLNLKYTDKPQKEIVSQLLKEKAAQLTKIDQEKFRLLKGFLGHFPEFDFPTFNSSSIGLIIGNSPQTPPHSKFINRPSPYRLCLSCGKNISYQRENTIFCSALYVGERAAHHCRNTNSNRRNNLKRKIQKELLNGVLFPISETYDWGYLREIFLVNTRSELLAILLPST